MRARLDPIAELATEAARAALPESVAVGDATLLPRGADPFIGSPRPTLLAATRWAVVSPGGVLIGGDPSGLAAMFGFEVPEKVPAPPPEARKPGDPPPVKWADLVTEEARGPLTTFSHAVANAVITLAGLPPDCAPTQLSLNDSDVDVRGEVGPISDAVVLLLHAGGHEARVVVVVPGIVLARMDSAAADTDVVQSSGGTLARPVAGSPALLSQQLTSRPLDAALAKVPLDLSVELGCARVPLAKVLHLGDGEVLELRQTIDAPVDLVCESFTVARGDLEIDAVGNLVLHVTSVPGGRKKTDRPLAITDSESESGVEASLQADAATLGGDGPPQADAPADATERLPADGALAQEPAAADEAPEAEEPTYEPASPEVEASIQAATEALEADEPGDDADGLGAGAPG